MHFILYRISIVEVLGELIHSLDYRFDATQPCPLSRVTVEICRSTRSNFKNRIT